MSRLVKDWRPLAADEAAIAPHRYRWNADGLPDGLESSMKEWRAKVPYQPGDVVWIMRRDGKAARALIRSVEAEYDRYGDRRERYRVQPETAAGLFSRMWEYTYPGPIQRGYLAAGLAPDLEGKI